MITRIARFGYAGCAHTRAGARVAASARAVPAKRIIVCMGLYMERADLHLISDACRREGARRVAGDAPALL
jgi:hypothetical protein